MRKALVLVLLAACYDTSSAPTCRIQCTTDADCTDGLTCGAGNLCTDGADCLQPDMCTPDEFIACVDTMAHSCNAAGDGTTDVACASGCNATERRCNDCVPDAMSCATDMMSVQQCTPDGRTQNVADTCAGGCNPGDTTVAAHCSYLQPAWLPDICDMPASGDLMMQSGSIATNIDTSCDQIITQMSNGNPIGPQICVIRKKTITVPGAVTVTFTGARAIALVADSQLTVTGTLDVSANQSTHTPGPGVAGQSGVASTASAGGGGAGFGNAGGNGGTTTTGAGGAGGAAIDPLTRAFFAGGYSGGSPSGFNLSDTFGGAGGGGLLLIACRGSVTVAGTIDAGGEGGRPNHDMIAGDGLFTNSKGPSGAGSGGYVVIQGLTITVSGQVYANGGGGAGGGNVQDAGGVAGSKGLRSTSAASGGTGTNSTGGNGGVNTLTGQNGLGANSAGFGGGGGGGVGVIHTYTPSGVIPTTTGSTMSPAYLRKTSVLR